MNRWRLYSAGLAFLVLCLPLAFAQPKPGKGGRQGGGEEALKQDFTNYRGQRKPVESDALYMETFSSLYDGGTLTIEIGFNQGIDPRSIKRGNIAINGVPVSETLRLSFNKEGTAMRLVIADTVSIPYSFSISGIRSYNGKRLDEGGLDGIGGTDSFCYQAEKDEWLRK